MTKLMSAFTIATLGAAVFASPALAGDKMNVSLKTTPGEASTMMETADAKTFALSTEANTEVLGAVERGELIAVEGPDGRVYYNRLIPVSELPDPELNLRVVETFEVEHDGQVFTNKFVQTVN